MCVTTVIEDKTLTFATCRAFFVSNNLVEKEQMLLLKWYDVEFTYGKVSFEPSQGIDMMDMAKIIKGIFNEKSNFAKEAKRVYGYVEDVPMTGLELLWYSFPVRFKQEDVISSSLKKILGRIKVANFIVFG